MCLRARGGRSPDSHHREPDGRLRFIWIWFVVPSHNTVECVLFSYPLTWVVTSIAFVIYYLKGGWLQRCIQKSGLEKNIYNFFSMQFFPALSRLNSRVFSSSLMKKGGVSIGKSH